MPNEDCTGSFDNKKISCIVISDGVSSCAQSKKGAETVVETVLRLFRNCGDMLFDLTNDQIVKTVCEEIQFALKEIAATEGNAIEDYSATVAFAACQKKSNQLILFSLGDSTVVTCNKQKVNISCKADKRSSGTYTVTTKNGYTTAYMSRQNAENIVRVYLLTDGAWNVTEELYPAGFQSEDFASTLCTVIAQSDNFDDSSFASLNLN